MDGGDRLPHNLRHTPDSAASHNKRILQANPRISTDEYQNNQRRVIK